MTRIHTHASGEGGIFANASAVVTHHGVVAIDARLTVSESRTFRKTLDVIGKPLLAVLVTHGHPDHVAGIGEVVRGRDVPMLALPAVAGPCATTHSPPRWFGTRRNGARSSGRARSSPQRTGRGRGPRPEGSARRAARPSGATGQVPAFLRWFFMKVRQLWRRSGVEVTARK